MNANFAKVLGLLLVLALMLSGCNLIGVDPKKQADEEIAKLAPVMGTVVAAYDGGEVTVGEAMSDFNMLYNETANMYYYFGMALTHEDVHMMIDQVIGDHVRAEVAASRFDASYTLDEAEVAQMEEDIQLNYDANLEIAMQYATGDTDDARRENARVLLYESGMDYDTLYSNIEIGTKYTRMKDILRDEVTEVSDEELQQAYDARVEEQKLNFVDGTSLENAMSGDETIVCWMPEGYRTVKHILLRPNEDLLMDYDYAAYDLETAHGDLEFLNQELAAANDDDLAEGERTPEEIQKEIDAITETLPALEEAVANAEAACLADVQDTIDEIYVRLEAGEDFETLIAEYGEDPGMQNEPTMSRGYYVSAGSVAWEPNFRDAAMALEQVGDYTLQPVLSGSGVHIILYASDVPAGEVGLENVRDSLYPAVLEEQKELHCQQTLDAWVAEANPSYDSAAFEAAIGMEH